MIANSCLKRMTKNLSKLFFSIILAISLVGITSACGSSENDAFPTPEDPAASKGLDIFQDHCATCHSLEPDTVIIGPSLIGIGTRASTRMAEFDAEEYIRLSLRKPDIYIVDGFSNLMPVDIARNFSDEEMDAIVSFLMTLK